MNKIVYITGCLGFIGSHLTRKCLSLGWNVIGVDKMTYACNPQVLNEFLSYNNFKFSKIDINDLKDIIDCDYVINMAAESHVDNSISNSDDFLRSNINGVQNLLKIIKNKKNRPIFFQTSSDETYGDIINGNFSEGDKLTPSNPYAATKASADMLILAWSRTFGIDHLIVRPTNNYGTFQHFEKLIPKSCKCLKENTLIPLHLKGLARRTWLHVEDTASAIIRLVESGVKNQIFNISGNYEDSNINVVKKIIYHFNGENKDFEKYFDFSFERPGQDLRYSVDDSKLKSLGWQNQKQFDIEIKNIVNFYKSV